MTSPLNIQTIEVRDAIGGGIAAALHAPANAPAGSLAPLAAFLNQQPGIRATPAYLEEQQTHALQISGLRDEPQLQQLLLQQWPAWNHDTGHNIPITFDHALHFDRQNDTKAGVISGFVQQHASQLASLSYLIGNLGILYSAWNNPASNGTPSDAHRHDWFKAYSSVAYSLATITLTMSAHNADTPRDIATIIEQNYPQPSSDSQAKKLWRDMCSFIRTHPWEISSAINATAAGAHLISAAGRAIAGSTSARYEALSALGTITAMGLVLFTPSPRIDHAGFPSDAPNILETAETINTQAPEGHGLLQQAQSFWQWMQHNPLFVPAALQAVSNAGYGVAALKRQPVDRGLLTASAAWLTGNLIQTQAAPSRTPSFDALITQAADTIRSDPRLANEDAQAIDRRIHNLSASLHRQRDIPLSTHQIESGIRHQLAKQSIEESETIIQESPFISEGHAQQVLQERSTIARTGIASL